MHALSLPVHYAIDSRSVAPLLDVLSLSWETLRYEPCMHPNCSSMQHALGTPGPVRLVGERLVIDCMKACHASIVPAQAHSSLLFTYCMLGTKLATTERRDKQYPICHAKGKSKSTANLAPAREQCPPSKREPIHCVKRVWPIML